MVTNIDGDVVIAVYYNSRGRALQQEAITVEIRKSRQIEAVSIPDAPRSEGGVIAGCPGSQFPCKKPGGGMGCCG
jgi:hypothetical protein